MSIWSVSTATMSSIQILKKIPFVLTVMRRSLGLQIEMVWHGKIRMLNLETPAILRGLVDVVDENLKWFLPFSCCPRACRTFSSDLGWFQLWILGRTWTQIDGEPRYMQDAKVWKTMKDTNGKLFFFGPHVEEEIHLGVSFSLDWYGMPYLFHFIHWNFVGSSEGKAVSHLVNHLGWCHSVSKI